MFSCLESRIFNSFENTSILPFLSLGINRLYWFQHSWYHGPVRLLDRCHVPHQETSSWHDLGVRRWSVRNRFDACLRVHPLREQLGSLPLHHIQPGHWCRWNSLQISALQGQKIELNKTRFFNFYSPSWIIIDTSWIHSYTHDSFSLFTCKLKLVTGKKLGRNQDLNYKKSSSLYWFKHRPMYFYLLGKKMVLMLLWK